MKKKLLIILLSGKEDEGRKATIALSMAVSAACSEIDTTVFLTGGGTIWGEDRHVKDVSIPGFEPLSKYMDDFITMKGKLFSCYTCSKFFCGLKEEENKGLTKPNVNPHLEFTGFSTITDLAVESSVMSF